MLKLVTHSGPFHPDDCFVTASLKILLGEEVEIIRTRDEEIISQGDFVYDVGGIYDEEKNRFDHHQAGGAGRRENGIPYASFGLVWKKYGEKICGSKEVAENLDKKIVSPIDALDNGFDISNPIFKGVYNYDIGCFFDALNKSWKEDDLYQEKAFIEAVSLSKNILEREIVKQKAKLESANEIEEVYKNAENKKLVILNVFYPWKDVLLSHPEPLFAVYPNNNKWSVQAVPVEKHSFKNRALFPESWAGKTGVDFAQVSGVSDALFCHNGRFLAVAESKEGAIKLAKIALGEEK